ncbi:sigma 54-interacting transcriptional regulator [Bacillaceae bacterium Marseille-Q3522]|nr:sigma 54-interacting transcriptional regulator [Bacillaceae bacterium Marseille-Q3522]
MTRKQKIYEALKELCRKVSLEDLENGFSGFETSEMSEITGVIRNNVSKELNTLVREKKIIKIKGHPVHYFDKERLQHLVSGNLAINESEVESIKELIHSEPTSIQYEDIFHQLIGAERSLDVPIKQAKAAIFYPPRGLHTLLIGPTGSGKTTFAEIMYQYAQTVGTLKENAQFIIFNCAEYADNPQLILSQLFGHMKGAFTGADRENPGLIEKANGGILLLDEVHRLPPEGQEMLFMLIDKNKYRRVGETSNTRSAEVLLIAATTEDVDSVLLKTFLRRIPMVIKLPSLSERTLAERYELINSLFSIQSDIIHAPIRVYKDVLKALLLYDCKGNIGQLKSDIQLICARGFLEYKTQKKVFIEIDTPFIPEHVYNGLLNNKGRRNEIFELLEGGNRRYYEFPQNNINKNLFNNKYHDSEKVYFELTEIYNIYSKRGYSQEKINKKMNQIVEKYLKQLLKMVDMHEKIPENEILFKVVSPRVYTAVENALSTASDLLKKKISKKVVIALAMHIHALPERQSKKISYDKESLNKIAINNPEEYKAAKMIRKEIEQALEMDIPKVEEGFIAMFLHAVDAEEINQKVGVVILAHGASTASSIAEVCNVLLSTNHCKAIDMSLDDKIEDVLDRAVEIVQRADQGKGVLLLVDMGSLVAFGKIIEERTGIKTSTIQMVSTPIALEAVRKCLMSDMSLAGLTEDLRDAVPKKESVLPEEMAIIKQDVTRKMIVTTCITSEGTAVKLAGIIKDSIPIIADRQIVVQPMTIQKIKSLSLEKLDHILVFAGSINPKIINIPYISTDEIVISDGLERINEIINGGSFSIDKKRQIPNLTMKIIEESLSFLNPQKAYEVLKKALEDIVNMLNIEKTDHLKAGFLMHCTCMIERVIRKESLPYKDISACIQEHAEMYKAIKKSLQIAEDTFGMIIPDTEIGYLIDMIDTD